MQTTIISGISKIEPHNSTQTQEPGQQNLDKGTGQDIKWVFIDQAPSFKPDTRNSDNKMKTNLSAHAWELQDKEADHNIRRDFIEQNEDKTLCQCLRTEGQGYRP